jgi:hypothetical protein
MQTKMILAGIVGLFMGLSVSGQTTDENVMIRDENTPMPRKYGRNVLAFSPIQFSENGVAGLGVSYEHVIDAAGILSFYVPVSAVLSIDNSFNTDYYGNTVEYRSDPMFYLMPGVKIYPTGCFGKARYAIGPSLVVAAGQKTEYNYDYPYTYPGPTNYYGVTRDRFLLGMMVNQSVNINPTPHLYIGAELGLGFTYLHLEDGVNRGTVPLFQFGFKVGYRF